MFGSTAAVPKGSLETKRTAFHGCQKYLKVLIGNVGGGSVWACANFHITLCQTSPTLASVYIASPCQHVYMNDDAHNRLKSLQASLVKQSQKVSGTNIYHPAHHLVWVATFGVPDMVLVLGGASVWACASFHITLCQTSPTLASVFIASPCQHVYMNDDAHNRLKSLQSSQVKQSQKVSGTNIYHPAHHLVWVATFGVPDMVLVLGGASVWACASFHITLCQTSPTLASVFIASPCQHVYMNDDAHNRLKSLQSSQVNQIPGTSGTNIETYRNICWFGSGCC